MKQYYYQNSLNDVTGPVSLDALKQLRREEKITSHTQVNEVGEEDWYPFDQIDTGTTSNKDSSQFLSESVIASADSLAPAALPQSWEHDVDSPKTHDVESSIAYDVKAGIQTTPLKLYTVLKWFYYGNLIVAIILQLDSCMGYDSPLSDADLDDLFTQEIIFDLWITAFVWWGLAELVKVIHTAAYSIDRIRIKLESD